MKGWTVRTESVKNATRGVAGRDVYMINMEHVNHVNTERIVPIFGTDRAMSNISYAGESYAAKQAANGRGGRPPSSYAVEFTLNLPKGCRPTKRAWRSIVEHCLKQTAKQCLVKPSQIASTSRAVLHQQRQDGQGTGDHVHLVIGKFTEDGKYLRNLQRKTVTAKIKQTFNAAVKHYCGYDWTEYAKTLQEQQYPNKRPVPTWKIRAARETEAIRLQQVDLDKRAELLVGKTRELDSLQGDIEDNFSDLMAVKRLTKNFMSQAEKWQKALSEGDRVNMNRQSNRLHRTVDEIGGFSVSAADQRIMDDMTRKINARSGSDIPTVTESRNRNRMKM